MTSPILYHLSLSKPLFPQPSHLRLPPPPPIITEEEIPNSSVPKHPPNVTLSRSSQHESHHFNNDQYFEVPANSIPSSPAQFQTISSPMQINHSKSSHTLSSPHIENPKNNLLPSQSNPPTTSNAPTPGIRDLSPPILDETNQDLPSSLIPPESQRLDSPNDQFSIFTDEF
ncbi:hypothetical protein O181_001628 [Austropuccinia psidii MF-1]|uniref:Uncharacterized protein n=1 Tax=Austropuccinia psidii MF-1 TaxID=1389203 RepID=A0A9Q3BAW2_9BASI|nr:hypothetical protein [Austropuccinia psidii MF-1]